MKRILLACLFVAIGYAHAKDDVPLPDQMPLTGAILKFHKGASQAFLERYIPDLKCQPFQGTVLCSTPVDEISQIFVRNVKCAGPKPITYTIKNGKAVSVSCHVEEREARRLSALYSKSFGQSAKQQKDFPPMLARQEVWNIGGGDQFTVMHFYGNNVRGEPIKDYMVRMAPQDVSRTPENGLPPTGAKPSYFNLPLQDKIVVLYQLPCGLKGVDKQAYPLQGAIAHPGSGGKTTKPTLFCFAFSKDFAEITTTVDIEGKRSMSAKSFNDAGEIPPLVIGSLMRALDEANSN